MEVAVILGAVELPQQLFRSLSALQQYVCMFHADTGLSPWKSLFAAMLLDAVPPQSSEACCTYHQGKVVDTRSLSQSSRYILVAIWCPCTRSLSPYTSHYPDKYQLNQQADL
jgi:hypothetical protein